MNIFKNFATTANQLSTFEDNDMSVELKHSHTDTIISVETFIFKTEEAQDNTTYEQDLDLTYLANTFTVSAAKITINLTIPKTDLEFGVKYHVAVVVHDSSGKVTSHLSPALVASHYAFTSPIITGTIENTELTANNHIVINRYEEITAKVVIDPTPYNANLAALGMTGNFEANFIKATCKSYAVVVTSRAADQTLLIANNATKKLLSGSGTFEKIGDNYEISTSFRYTGNEVWWLVWELELRQNLAGTIDYVTIQYLQKITPLSASNDIEVMYFDEYDNSIEYTNEQDDEFIAEVTKTGIADVADVNLTVIVVDNQTGAVRQDIAEVIENFTGNNSTALVKIKNSKLEKGKSYNLVTFIV